MSGGRLAWSKDQASIWFFYQAPHEISVQGYPHIPDSGLVVFSFNLLNMMSSLRKFF